MSFVEIALYILVVQAVLLLIVLAPFVPVGVVNILHKTYGLIFRNQVTASVYYCVFGVMLLYGCAQFFSAQRQADQIKDLRDADRHLDFEKEMNARMRQFHDQRNGYITIFAAYLSLALGLAFRRINNLAAAARPAAAAASGSKSSSSSSSPVVPADKKKD